jgi:hypothetical protein
MNEPEEEKTACGNCWRTRESHNDYACPVPIWRKPHPGPKVIFSGSRYSVEDLDKAPPTFSSLNGKPLECWGEVRFPGPSGPAPTVKIGGVAASIVTMTGDSITCTLAEGPSPKPPSGFKAWISRLLRHFHLLK